MRINIRLQARRGQLRLPVHYGEVIQGFVYHQLDPILADWLHNQGYTTPEGRRYPMFTFSRLQGHYERVHDRTHDCYLFAGPVAFQLAAYDVELLCSLGENLLRCPERTLNAQECRITGVEILPDAAMRARPLKVKTLSPITTYSTFELEEKGKKKTYYYEPFEDLWSRQLLGNLARKARALGWEDGGRALADAWIAPYRISERRDKHIVRYKGSFVIAWSGRYQLSLPEAYLRLAYDTGLGSKSDVIQHCRLDCLSSHAAHLEKFNKSFAFYHPQDGGLGFSVAPLCASRALRDVFVPFLAADIGFIYLYCVLERGLECRGLESVAQAVKHKPGGLLGDAYILGKLYR